MEFNDYDQELYEAAMDETYGMIQREEEETRRELEEERRRELKETIREMEKLFKFPYWVKVSEIARKTIIKILKYHSKVLRYLKLKKSEKYINVKLEKYLNKALILYNNNIFNFNQIKKMYHEEFFEKYTHHILFVSHEGFIFYNRKLEDITLKYKINTIFKQAFLSFFDFDLKI